MAEYNKSKIYCAQCYNKNMILDKTQEQIANDFNGKIAVVAGPGSGKTRVLIERAEKIYNSGEKPQNILIISYTNKVRSEIKNRLRNRNQELEKVEVHTFHSFGVQLLRRYGQFVGIEKNFEVLDEEDQKTILNNIYTELNIKKSDFPIKQMILNLRTKYGEYAKKCQNSDEFVKLLSAFQLPQKHTDEIDIIDTIFRCYTFYKRNDNYLDFDDILVYTNALLYKREEARKIVQNFKYVMVDEAQDLSIYQYEFIHLLEDNGVENILLVGDLDQNIYSWRGARPRLFMEFYQKSKKYSLNINYRSTSPIVQCSKSLIKHNKDRIKINLISNIHGDKVKPVCNCFKSNPDELSWVAKNIKSVLNSGVSPSEIAILYRANYLSRGIENELIKNDIKYVIYNGFEFYQRKEIKDCISLLKLSIDKNDKIALERTLLNLPNIGPRKVQYILNNNSELLSKSDKKVINKLFDIINDSKKYELISSKLQYIVDQLGYKKELWNDGNFEDRIENYSELLRFIETFDNELIGLQEFLDNISLLNKRDERTNINESIKLMTLHSAKGLEFKYVYIISALDGILPNERSVKEDLLEEERRLMYVGITRAKEHLYITASPFYGYSNAYQVLSRFIKEAKIKINNFSQDGYDTLEEQKLLALIRNMADNIVSMDKFCSDVIKVIALDNSELYQKMLGYNSRIVKIFNAASHYLDKDYAGSKSMVLSNLFQALEEEQKESLVFDIKTPDDGIENDNLQK